MSSQNDVPSRCNRTWLEIDLDALNYNLQQINTLLPKNHTLIATVKANAYGHGDHCIAYTLQQSGVHFFAVSNLDEAIGLRRCGICGEILVLGYTQPDDAPLLAGYDIIQTIYASDCAKAFSQVCQEHNITIRAHLKLDTGMGRIGFLYDDPNLLMQIKETSTLPGISVEGIFTHLSSADMSDAESNVYTNLQLQRFSNTVHTLRENGVPVNFAHIQNSAGILRRLSPEFEGSRAGIILYGMYPSDETEHSIPLKALMSWKAVISCVKEVPAGHSISYGRHFTSERPTRIATIPVGYADGYPRILSGKGYCLVNGVKCPILGNICMDQMMLDISAVPQAAPGDIVTIMGQENNISITAEVLAQQSNTINYEITCNPSRRVPRVYLQNRKIIATENDALICADYAAAELRTNTQIL